MNMPRDLVLRRRPQKGRVVLGGDVNQPLFMAAVGERHRRGEPQIAVLLAHIQMLEYRRRHPVRHARAHRARALHQRQHPARPLRRAAMIVGALPEPPRPALDAGGPALQKRKVRLENQRAVAEQPDIGPAAQVVAGFIEFGSVESHNGRKIQDAGYRMKRAHGRAAGQAFTRACILHPVS